MKERIKTWLIKHLFHTIDMKSVIYCDPKGIIFLGGEQISKSEAEALREEAKFVEKTRIWRIMTETVRFKAEDIGFTKSISFDDVKTGKLMIVNLDIIESIIAVAKKVK